MKKKYGVNIMLFVFIIISVIIISCVKSDKKQESGILIQTDRDFAALSVKEGMIKAFLTYIADTGIILRDNSFPIRGKAAYDSLYKGKSDTAFVLNWEPVFESMAKSGELGYTYGFHTTTDKKTGEVSNGMYVTVWKKQKDGNWRFIMDSGTQGLPAGKE